MTRGNTATQTTTSEHTNQTQMTADDIVAAVPSGQETTSNICRKQKKITTTTTQNGQLRSFDALGNPHLHIHKIRGTRAEHKEERNGHIQRRDGAPPTRTLQGIHGQHPPGLHLPQQGTQENIQWSFKRPPPETRKQIQHQRRNPHQG
jgi:hypothetical protein